MMACPGHEKAGGLTSPMTETKANRAHKMVFLSLGSTSGGQEGMFGLGKDEKGPTLHKGQLPGRNMNQAGEKNCSYFIV